MHSTIYTNITTISHTICLPSTHAMQLQMEKKTTRRWQLADVLHSAGEASLSTSEYDNPDSEVNLARIEPRDPRLIGAETELDILDKTGLPKSLSETAKFHIFLSIRKDTRGRDPPLTWTTPIMCATQMKTTLEDHQVHADDDRRYRNVIIRAQPSFQGIPAYDNVKAWIEEDAGRKSYFAKLFAFFRDSLGHHYVGLQWYAEAPILPPGAILRQPCLELEREDRSSSYSILPAECIVNGAVLFPCVGKMWALQSPREEQEYIRNHSTAFSI